MPFSALVTGLTGPAGVVPGVAILAITGTRVTTVILAMAGVAIRGTMGIQAMAGVAILAMAGAVIPVTATMPLTQRPLHRQPRQQPPSKHALLG